MGEQNYGIDVNVARSVAEELKAVHDMGVQVAVVVGGGISFEESLRVPATWIVRPQTTSVCWRR
jgi:uridylate kinase